MLVASKVTGANLRVPLEPPPVHEPPAAWLCLGSAFYVEHC